MASSCLQVVGISWIYGPLGYSASFWAQLARKRSCAGQCSTKKGCFLPFQMLSPRFPRPGHSRAGALKEVRVVGKAPGGYSHPHPCVTSGKLLLGKQDRPVGRRLYCVHIGEEMQWNVSLSGSPCMWYEMRQYRDWTSFQRIYYTACGRGRMEILNLLETLGQDGGEGPWDHLRHLCFPRASEACDLAYKIFPILSDQLCFQRCLKRRE